MTHSSAVTALRVADEAFLVASTIERCPKTMMLRELAMNALEAARLAPLYIAPSLDWVPVGAYADYANTVRTPGYALFGVQAGFSVPTAVLPQGSLPYAISFYVDARNLTNQHYISDLQPLVNASAPGPNPSIYFPGDGRAVYAGMRVTF